jgi:hypothetical protein
MLFGGTVWIIALFVAISAVTGHRFEISGDGVDRGVPLPSNWFYAMLFTAVGGAFWWLGGRWDAPRFVAFRQRRPWVVPLVATFVVAPLTLVVMFLLVR